MDERIADPEAMLAHADFVRAVARSILRDEHAAEDVTQEVLADDRGRVEVRLVVRRGGVVRGTVVDPDGRPVSGALVFPGRLERGRGDEPFKPFKPVRITDGVSTGADGAFEVRAGGAPVSIWHEQWSPSTVGADAASHVVLKPRGRIRGIARKLDGTVWPSVKVSLDRKPAGDADAEGRFAIDGVESGVRGLSFGEERNAYVAIPVEPGRTTDVDLAGALPEVRITLATPLTQRADGRRRDEVALLVPSGMTAPLVMLRAVEGGLVGAQVPVGRYVLIGEGGVVLPVEVRGPAVKLDAATAPLTIRGKPGVRVFVVPAGSDELVELMSARAAPKTLGADGTVRFDVVPGRWSAGWADGGSHRVLRDVEVPAAGAEVAVP